MSWRDLAVRVSSQEARPWLDNTDPTPFRRDACRIRTFDATHTLSTRRRRGALYMFEAAECPKWSRCSVHFP